MSNFPILVSAERSPEHQLRHVLHKLISVKKKKRPQFSDLVFFFFFFFFFVNIPRPEGSEQRLKENTDCNTFLNLCCCRALYQNKTKDIWDLKLGLSSLLFINLIAAVIRGGDLHCWVFTFCDVECQLKLEDKCALHHEHGSMLACIVKSTSYVKYNSFHILKRISNILFRLGIWLLYWSFVFTIFIN